MLGAQRVGKLALKERLLFDLVRDVLARERERQLKDALVQLEQDAERPQIPLCVLADVGSLHLDRHLGPERARWCVGRRLETRLVHLGHTRSGHGYLVEFGEDLLRVRAELGDENLAHLFVRQAFRLIEELRELVVRLGQDGSLAADGLTELDVEALVLLADIHELVCAALVQRVDGFERVSVKIELVVHGDLHARPGGQEVALGGARIHVLVEEVC